MAKANSENMRGKVTGINRCIKDADYQLLDYDVLINLPDAVYKYNSQKINPADLMDFFHKRYKSGIFNKVTISLISLK